MAALSADTVSWVQCKDGGIGTLNAVFAGIDKHGGPLYVARFNVGNDLVPGKAAPQNKCAYASYGGDEKHSTTYEVLQCKGEVSWVQGTCGGVPPGALITGKTSSNDSLYTCRVNHGNTVTIGKVHPRNKTAYIPFDGKEISVQDYQVLVVKPSKCA